MSELAERGFATLVTCDSSMLSASVRRNVWRLARISIFLCDGKWGNLPLFETARRLIWYWPEINRQSLEAPQGGAWRLAADPQPSGMRRVLDN